MRQFVRVPKEYGETGVGCYKYDAKAFALSSFLVMLEVVGLAILRSYLLNHWTSTLCPAFCSILAVIAIVYSFIAFGGYICAFISASEYCTRLRGASQ